MLTKYAPGFIAAKMPSPTRPRVSGVSARCTVTASALSTARSGVSARSMSSDSASSGVRLRDHARTRIPRACARTITSRPMVPVPSTASLRPRSPRALPKAFLFQVRARSSATLSAMRRSRLIRWPMVSSATALAFLPGQFET